MCSCPQHDLPEYDNPKRARTHPPVHCGPLVDPPHALTPVLHSCARCSCSRSSGRRLNPAPPRPARVRACAAPAQEDEKLPPAPYETVKDAPGSNVDGEGAQWSSGLAHSGRERVAYEACRVGCLLAQGQRRCCVLLIISETMIHLRLLILIILCIYLICLERCAYQH
jgi:hypothetical protein